MVDPVMRAIIEPLIGRIGLDLSGERFVRKYTRASCKEFVSRVYLNIVS